MRSADDIRKKLTEYQKHPHSVACRDGEILYDTGYVDALSWVLGGELTELSPDREKLLKYALTVLTSIATHHRHLVPMDLVGDVRFEEATHDGL